MSSLSEAMTKKVVRFFSKEKIGWHPSVAAPGVTNPSDATATSGLKSDVTISGYTFTPGRELKKWGGRLNLES